MGSINCRKTAEPWNSSVCDGCLRLLPADRAGSNQALQLLADLYGRIVIPTEVYEEIVVAGRGLPGAEKVRRADWIHARAVPSASDPSPSKASRGLELEREARSCSLRPCLPICCQWMSGERGALRKLPVFLLSAASVSWKPAPVPEESPTCASPMSIFLSRASVSIWDCFVTAWQGLDCRNCSGARGIEWV